MIETYSTNSLSWGMLDYENGTILNLHYGLIHSGLPTQIDCRIDKLPFIKSEYMPKHYTLCEEGDIAFADASEDTEEVGKVVEFSKCSENNIVCGLHTIHARDKIQRTVVGYKGYAFSSVPFHHQIRRIAQGTKIYSINTRNFEEVYVGVPSKAEQRKIADFLSLIDDRINTQSKIIEEYKTVKTKIRDTVFDKIETEATSEIQIKDYVDYEQPGAYIVADTEYSSDISLTPVLTANKAFVLGYTEEKDGVYNKGDCIIFDDFTMDSKLVTFPFKVKSSAIKILTTKPNLSLIYFFEHLQYLSLNSVEHKRHYISEIECKYMPLPSLDVQLYYANMFALLDKKIAIEEKILNGYEQMKKYLLKNLFI